MTTNHIPVRITTRTLNLFSAQQVFDFVVNAVLQQGRPATVQRRIDGDTWRTLCEYKTPDGLRCAVGFLIPDECRCYLSGSVAGWKPEHFERALWALDGNGMPAHRALLEGLQRCHDEAAMTQQCFLKYFISNVEALARKHGLAFNHDNRGGRYVAVPVLHDIAFEPVSLHGADVQQPVIQAKPGVCVPVFS